MKYSSLVGRISGETVSAWDIHYAACAAQARGEDAIVLSIGDPDFTTAEPIRAAAVEALAQGDTHYTEVIGRAALREAIAAKQRRLLGIPVGAGGLDAGGVGQVHRLRHQHLVAGLEQAQRRGEQAVL
ncbi:hypothetical protein R0G64_25875, partial [Pseudomonas otitidis]|nr:hypothetical protein [Pseudomonas otitidis]